MKPGAKLLRIFIGLIAFLLLCGASPCSDPMVYRRSRNCTDLAVTVEAGKPGVLIPDCIAGSGQPMEITYEEQITFTSVPADLRAVIVPTNRSNEIRISALATAPARVEIVEIHTEPRGRGLHQFANDYTVTVRVTNGSPSPSPSPSPTVCPTVSVTGPASVDVGQPITFNATVNPAHAGLTYNWTISEGSITSGQGTASLAVDSTGLAGQIVTATVVVGVLDSTCPNRASFSTDVNAPPSCPTVDVTGPASVNAGQVITFNATVNPASAGLTYRWAVSDGSGGQTTQSITVDSTGHAGQSITATVDVGGLDSRCVHTAGYTTQVLTPPSGPTVTVTANPLTAPTGGSTTLSAVVSGGVGPFNYQWNGIRDDGTPFNFTFSDTTAAQPTVGLIFPGSDFYFFVVVTDTGLPVGTPGRIANAYIRMHESDGPVAKFNISSGPFHANVTDIHFDANASVGVSTPIMWTLQYIGDVQTPSDIEGFLTLESNSGGTLFWDDVFSTPTDLMTLDLDHMNITQPGAYRMLLQVNGGFSSHQTYEYFMVEP